MRMVISENILQSLTLTALKELLSESDKEAKSISNDYICAIINLSLFEYSEDNKCLFESHKHYKSIINSILTYENTSSTLFHSVFLGQIIIKKGINEDTKVLERIDAELFEKVQSQINLPSIALSSGFNDILNYFSQNKENKRHIFFTKELINQLVQVIKKDELGIRIVQSGNVDFTFPLGMSGLLIQLIKIYNSTLKDAGIKSIIDDAIKYLLNCKNDIDFSENAFDFFPDHILNYEVKRIFSNQMSLSSGDLSKAFLLYQYSTISDDTNILKLANFAGLNTLIRKSQFQHNVTNSSLLNGSSGIALMYHKMLQFSKIGAYNQGKIFWIEKTVDFLNDESPSNFSRKADIWEGKLGVSLALLSGLTDKTLSWEKIYGLSM